MKTFINPTILCALIVSIMALTVGCSQTPKKAIEQAQNAEETPQFRSFDAMTINQVQYSLDDFGPDPFTLNRVEVSKEDKKAFANIVKTIKAGKIEKAENALQLLSEKSPEYSGPAYNLAVIKSRQGDTEGAIEYLKLALNRNYYNQKARNLLGYLYRQKGDFQSAEKLWLDNLVIWGGYAASYRNLGILYDLYMGKPEKAIGYYKQYNQLQAEPDKLVQGWIVSIDRRLAYAKKNNKTQTENKNMNDASQKQVSGDQDKAGSVQ